jgi:hypothetical protein
MYGNPEDHSRSSVSGWHEDFSMQCRIEDEMWRKRIKREKKELNKQKRKDFIKGIITRVECFLNFIRS